MDIKRFIIDERKKQRISRTRLSKMSSINYSTLTKFERGDTPLTFDRVSEVVRQLGYEMVVIKIGLI